MSIYRKKPVNIRLLHFFVLAGIALPFGNTASAVELSLANANGLGFGSLIAGGGSGTVTVNTDASRTCTGDIVCIPQHSPIPARFNVTGDPLAIYIITLPASALLSNSSGQSMSIDNFIDSEGGSGLLDSAGKDNFSIGATLRVGAGQSTGEYSGSFDVIVEYQ